MSAVCPAAPSMMKISDENNIMTNTASQKTTQSSILIRRRISKMVVANFVVRSMRSSTQFSLPSRNSRSVNAPAPTELDLAMVYARSSVQTASTTHMITTVRSTTELNCTAQRSRENSSALLQKRTTYSIKKTKATMYCVAT